MNQTTRLALRLELLWWIFTFALAAGILYPIVSNVNPYPFWGINLLYIVVFVTLTRYVFLLKFTFLAKIQWLKLLMILVSLPIIFALIHYLNLFQTFIDEKGPETLTSGLKGALADKMAAYIRSEMLLFAVGSVIISIIFPVRMLMSIWRVRNRGTV